MNWYDWKGDGGTQDLTRVPQGYTDEKRLRTAGFVDTLSFTLSQLNFYLSNHCTTKMSLVRKETKKCPQYLINRMHYVLLGLSQKKKKFKWAHQRNYLIKFNVLEKKRVSKKFLVLLMFFFSVKTGIKTNNLNFEKMELVTFIFIPTVLLLN